VAPDNREVAEPTDAPVDEEAAAKRRADDRQVQSDETDDHHHQAIPDPDIQAIPDPDDRPEEPTDETADRRHRRRLEAVAKRPEVVQADLGPDSSEACRPRSLGVVQGDPGPDIQGDLDPDDRPEEAMDETADLEVAVRVQYRWGHRPPQ
jgi:hypothetical protein